MNQRENSGALFENKRRKTEKHPNYTGSLSVTCQHCGGINAFEQSAWTKKDKNGANYYSQSFRVKQEQPEKHEPVRYGDEFESPF